MAGTSPVAVARIRHDQGENLLYPNRSTRIGRSSECDLVINDPKVSRSHALVEWDGSGYTIRDLGSSNGTFVNGERLSDAPHKLRDGDQIVVFEQVFTFETLQQAGTAPLSYPVVPEDEAPSSAKGPRLVVRSGADAGQEFVLWGDRVTIGRASRDASWEIRLSDRAVSRPHAALQREEDHFLLLDLGSANGTKVNGTPVDGPVRLNHGDLIHLGTTHLVFYD